MSAGRRMGIQAGRDQPRPPPRHAPHGKAESSARQRGFTVAGGRWPNAAGRVGLAEHRLVWSHLHRGTPVLLNGATPRRSASRAAYALLLTSGFAIVLASCETPGPPHGFDSTRAPELSCRCFPPQPAPMLATGEDIPDLQLRLEPSMGCTPYPVPLGCSPDERLFLVVELRNSSDTPVYVVARHPWELLVRRRPVPCLGADTPHLGCSSAFSFGMDPQGAAFVMFEPDRLLRRGESLRWPVDLAAALSLERPRRAGWYVFSYRIVDHQPLEDPAATMFCCRPCPRMEWCWKLALLANAHPPPPELGGLLGSICAPAKDVLEMMAPGAQVVFATRLLSNEVAIWVEAAAGGTP